jgi:hypothetical protein
MQPTVSSPTGGVAIRRRFERSRIEAELLAAVYEALLAAPTVDPTTVADSEGPVPVACAGKPALAVTTTEAS